MSTFSLWSKIGKIFYNFDDNDGHEVSDVVVYGVDEDVAANELMFSA